MPDVRVYDRARWHLEQDVFPMGAERKQAGVYGGFVLVWLVLSGETSEEFHDDWGNEIDLLKNKEILPLVFFELTGGTLSSEMLSERGNTQAHTIFEADGLDYYGIFDHSVAFDLVSPYYVADTWESFARIKELLDGICN